MKLGGGGSDVTFETFKLNIGEQHNVHSSQKLRWQSLQKERKKSGRGQLLEKQTNRHPVERFKSARLLVPSAYNLPQWKM